MGTIRVLDDITINKIAAGEVVERPASIVKELVENSIDAGATEISVEIEGGGISLIRITDNGKGIQRDDIETAFLRHATSKISSHIDLNSINTLGFRGEALASIAAVSRVEIISRTEEFPTGYRVYQEGGKLIEKEESGSPLGTTITVKDVFYNTPARLKFLKTESREGMYITDIMQNLAFSHPEISFKYKSKGKMVFATKGDSDLKSVILSIYGKEIASNVIEVNYSGDIVSIKGFLGNGSISRSSRNYQSTFINGRYIKNKTITAAVEAGYKSMLTINKFPVYVLHIYTNPEFIDVNVHPAKLEIKFQDEQLVFKSVYHCIRESLISSSPIVDVGPKETPFTFKENIDKVEFVQQKIHVEDKSPFVNIHDNPVEIVKEKETKKEDAPPISYVSISHSPIDHVDNIIKEDIKKRGETVPAPAAESRVPKFGPLAVVGQVHFTYIIAEGLDDMYLIDQHAAHERIYYEKYVNEYKNSCLQSQSLLVPIVIDLAHDVKQLVMDNIEFFKKLGYSIEDFGGNAIALRYVPVIYGNPDNKDVFLEIIENIDNNTGDLSKTVDKITYTMACKSAIKAGDKLNYREMTELIERLRYCDNPYTCPHGRPTIIKMTYTELEKKFKRIQ